MLNIKLAIRCMCLQCDSNKPACMSQLVPPAACGGASCGGSMLAGTAAAACRAIVWYSMVWYGLVQV